MRGPSFFGGVAAKGLRAMGVSPWVANEFLSARVLMKNG